MPSEGYRAGGWRAGLWVAASLSLLCGEAWAQFPWYCDPVSGVSCPAPPVIWGHYPTQWRRWPGTELQEGAAPLQPPAAVPSIEQEFRTTVPQRSDGTDLLEPVVPESDEPGPAMPMGNDAPPAPPVPMGAPMRPPQSGQAIGHRLRGITGQPRLAVQLASLDRPPAGRSAPVDGPDEDIWGGLAVEAGWRSPEPARRPALPAASGNPLRSGHSAPVSEPAPAPAPDRGPAASRPAPVAGRPNPLRSP